MAWHFAHTQAWIALLPLCTQTFGYVIGQAPFFRALNDTLGRNGKAVIGAGHMQPFGMLGLEGSFYTRSSDGIYHFLSAAELPAPPGWDYPETDVHMRFDHWSSSDGENWAHGQKIYESSGINDGSDRRGSTWAPMAAFSVNDNKWHLFYVAYRASPDYKIKLGLYGNKSLHFYTQWDGEIYHMVSNVTGELGIGGPYVDVGPVLNQEELGGFSPKKDGWEGDHGVDMFFPFQLPNGTWAALYGSEFGFFPNFCEPACRQVGLAMSDGGLNGHWSRISRLNPLDAGFRPARPGIENPVVTKTPSYYVKIQDAYCSNDEASSGTRLTGWISGTRTQAEKACDARSDCKGFHYNTPTSKYVLVSQVESSTENSNGPNACFLKDGGWYIAVYHVYTGPTIGVSYSKDGVHWIRQPGDLVLGSELCGDVVTTACGLVHEPTMGKGIYSLMYTAGGKCSKANCTRESACRAYLVNEAERDAAVATERLLLSESTFPGLDSSANIQV